MNTHVIGVKVIVIVLDMNGPLLSKQVRDKVLRKYRSEFGHKKIKNAPQQREIVVSVHRST